MRGFRKIFKIYGIRFLEAPKEIYKSLIFIFQHGYLIIVSMNRNGERQQHCGPLRRTHVRIKNLATISAYTNALTSIYDATCKPMLFGTQTLTLIVAESY